VGEEFLRVVVKSSQGHSSGFKIPLSPLQEHLVTRLLESLLGSRESVSAHLHELWWELIRTQDADLESTIHNCPFLAWWAVHALKKDGTFISADPFAQLLAKVKYLIKSVSMVEASKRQSSHPRGIIG
jgi:hypothetical protein